MSDTRMLELVAKLDDADELVCLAALGRLGAMSTHRPECGRLAGDWGAAVEFVLSARL